MPLPDAMTLATVDAGGVPDARMVLLKGVDAEGFRFFTNYESAKAAQLERDAAAALVVYWRELDRQVRIRGRGRTASTRQSDAYFATRPRESPARRLGLAAVRPLDSREELDGRVREVEARFADGRCRGPTHWGGYLLAPADGRVLAGPGRPPARPLPLHARGQAGWTIQRLGSLRPHPAPDQRR